MSSADAPSSPSKAVSPWRAAFADPAVGAIGLYTIVALGAAVAAYLATFVWFASYDDEGTLLVSLNAFVHGEALYRDVFSPYGPFYYEFFGSLFALSGRAVTNDAGRTLVILLWVGTSFLFGLATQRLTGRLLLGVAAMIVAFGVLNALFPEPMHPHGLLVFLLGAFTLVAVRGPGRRTLLAGGLAGALLAGVLLTKVNFGVYAIAAAVLAAALTAEPLNSRRWLRWPLVLAFLAMPAVIMAPDLREGWARAFVALELLGGAAIIAAAWPAQPRRGEEQGELWRWLVGAAAGCAAAAGAILLAIVALGSSPADLYDGMIVQAMNVRDVNPGPFETPGQAIDWGVAALAAAVLTARLRAWGSEEPSLWPGLLRGAAGLAIWFTIVRQAPFGLNPSTNQDVLPMLLAWVAAVPPSGALEPAYKRFLRVLFPAIAVAGVLGVYPVPGAQVGIAALMFVPVGAICIADALSSLRAWSASRGEVALARFGVATVVASAALAGMLALGQIVLPGASNAVLYSEREPLPFAGASQVRPEEAAREEYVGVVDFLERYRCSMFIGYPNVDSIYLWSDIKPPKPSPPGVWILALDERAQDRILAQMRATPRPCVIRNEAVAGAWLNGRPPPDTALVHYIFEDFETVAQSGQFELRLPKQGT